MKGLFFIFFFLIAVSSFPQEVPASTEQQLENLGEENIEDDALLQQLLYYRKNPLNLNTATADDLSLLRILTALQIQNFIRYRAAFGELLSIYELQAVPTFDLLTISRLLPFVFVGEEQSLKEALLFRLRGGNHSILFRVGRVLEKAKGYDKSLNTHYLGDPTRLQLRYSYQYKNLLSYGVVADKDAGEPFFSGAQNGGFDFYSIHFFARDLGRIKALALGDFVVNLGQGLTQWQSLGFGKSAEVLSIKRQAPVLLPYRSAGEFNFNRGAAATFQWRRWQATSFLSYKKFSGNRVHDSIDYFTSFATSGYHRTASEIADRKGLRDFSAGGNLSYTNGNLRLGASAVWHRFSLPLQKSGEPYNRFAPVGRSHFFGSLDYAFTYKNAHFFGELAADTRLNHALVTGALVSVDPKVDFSFLYRNIQKEYQAPFANAFTESSLPSNENGLYIGILLRPYTRWLVTAYADVYRFPFLRYRLSAPARGMDYLVQATYTPAKTTELYLRFRTESKPLDSAGGVIQSPGLQKRQNLRLQFATTFRHGFSLKGRVEKSWFAREGKVETGWLAYGEAAFAPTLKWGGNLRLQYFSTGSYDTRLYAYESDVLYSFSVPVFSGKGLRYYVNLNGRLSKQLTVWLRFAQTLYTQIDVVGTGLDEIKANHKTELKVQVQHRF